MAVAGQRFCLPQEVLKRISYQEWGTHLGPARAATPSTAARQSSLGGLRNCRERGGVIDGHVGEHATVNLDARECEPLDESVVGNAVEACSGIDALNPEAAEFTLLRTTVAVGVVQRVNDLFLGLAIEA